jgi:hypothetical protein
VPPKALQEHARIGEIVFTEEDEWQIHSGSEMIEVLRHVTADSEDRTMD